MINYIQSTAKTADDKDDLERALEDFGLYSGDEFRAVYGWYKLWVRSGFVALPFSGGVAEQPEWVIHDFNTFTLIENYLQVMQKRTEGFEEEAEGFDDD